MNQLSHIATEHDGRVLQALLRQDLGAFAERCFHEVASGKNYHHNWHLEALAYHLTMVAEGRCKRLVITLPPRSLKSLYASIAFPAWVLGHDSHRRIICASYGRALATAHANSCRSIIRTSWYRDLFPLMRIDPRKDTEDEVRTTREGFRLTATVGGALTGRGGSIIIIDDAMKADDARSDLLRASVNNWFDETLLSRLDDKRSDAIILVMQRLHVDDLVGHVLKAGGWTHLNLSAIAADDMRVPLGGGLFHDRAAGDLLHPEREPRYVLDELRTAMGSAAFSAQYLQEPVPAGGNLVQWEWFRTWKRLPEREDYQTKIVQSWDTASKATELNDYSVGITALIHKDAIYILDVVRARLEYPALKKRVVAEKERWKADIVLIEDKGSGQSLIQDLRFEHIYAREIKPEADKVVRMSYCTAPIESGAVLLPQSAPWLDAFRTELLTFPNGLHDDQVDALSQLINWTRRKSTYTLDYIS
ncbi:phage terminase large subunit [Xanthobacter autotrophicus]|uniref:phage terminase large subunit n=1 Tax=Xanthobacter autotrophicus TaxID=280 RepID=UPI0037295370